MCRMERKRKMSPVHHMQMHRASPIVANLSGFPNATRNMQRFYVPFLSFIYAYTPILRQAQRTVMPDLLVNILDAMFIDASSWKSNLAAYGMWICEIFVLFLHGRHSKDWVEILLGRSARDTHQLNKGTYAMGVMSPQMSQTWTLKASETSNNLSFRKAAAPCEIIQSRSISPKRRPPSLARPSTGCLVRICTGPRARAWILSSTMWRRRW